MNLKNVLKSAIILTILSFFIISCKKDKQELVQQFVFNKTQVTIGTFNMEWLGDGERDRKKRIEDDYKMYADIIIKMDADILAVEEIENANAIGKILKYLPGYSYYLTQEGGQQRIGIIFKKGIEAKLISEYSPLEIEPRKTKPGLLLNMKAGNFDFYIMAVHLKSSSHFDDTEEKQERSLDLREQQALVISKWADSCLRFSKERDLIVLGDFNDTPRRKKNNILGPLAEKLVFLTADLKSCKYPSAYGIDQIAVSSSALERVNTNSVTVFDLYSFLSDQQLKGLSDHCPVIATFDVTKPDKDNSNQLAVKLIK